MFRAMRRETSTLLLAGAVVTLALSVSGASVHEVFRQGIQAYAAGGYEQATNAFGEAIALSPSSGAFHNLGNAEWQLGRVGPALLAWERAQWLDPYSSNTRANLRFARKSAQLDAPDLAWYEICSKWLPVDAWAWMAGISLWTAIAAVMVPGIVRWRKADWHQGLAAAGFALAGAAREGLTAALCLAFAEGAYDLTLPVSWATVVDIGGRFGGTTGAFMNMASSISAMISSLSAAWLDARFGSFSAMLAIAAGVYLLGALLWLLVDPTRPISD